MPRFLKTPLFHCLLIGGLIAGWQIYTKPLPEIFVSQSEIKSQQLALAQTFAGAGKIPDESFIAEKLAEDEIIYQQAKKAGYDQLPSVINRLANVADFLQIVPPGSTLEERYQAALEMKLDETDVVVRRQMNTLYRSALKNSTVIDPPSNEAINQYYLNHQEKFEQPARYAFSHVYVQESSANGLEKISGILAVLKDQNIPPENAIEKGNVFYGGHHFNLQSDKQVARHLGTQFSNALNTLPLQQWSQPIESTFGWHIVWLKEKTDAFIKPVEKVKTTVVRELSLQAQEEKYQELLEKLKGQYQIVVEPGAPASSTEPSPDSPPKEDQRQPTGDNYDN